MRGSFFLLSSPLPPGEGPGVRESARGSYSMQSIKPLRSLTMRTVVVVRLACAAPVPLAARPAAHRNGVAAAQNLCTHRATRARLPARTAVEAMA
jgi:hypothetical protein